MQRVKSAIEIIKKYPIPLLLIPLAYSVIDLGFMGMIGPQLATRSIGNIFDTGFLSIGLVFILFEILRIIFLAGFLTMILVVLDGKEITLASFRDFLTKRRLLNVLRLEVVILPILAAGFMLLIIPGAYWFVATVMAYFMVVSDEDAGILDSISRSISITKGFKLIILSYSAIYMLITLISSSIPIISVIVDTFATPMFYIILALIYKECMVKDAEQ